MLKYLYINILTATGNICDESFTHPPLPSCPAVTVPELAEGPANPSLPAAYVMPGCDRVSPTAWSGESFPTRR